jgi:hypothetical protein
VADAGIAIARRGRPRRLLHRSCTARPEALPSNSAPAYFNPTGSACLKKLILLSVIIAAVVIPVRNARMKNSREGLKKTLIQTALFNLLYLFLVVYVWNRL